ncbi:MAG: response regulator [Magnetospirillum sp.]|nr:MAG: response regulator [Magnetospirillum sp.]
MLYDTVRVLVIDDKPYSRATTVRLLRGMGIRTIAEAVDGASGLEVYASLWPHVVVCEPEMKPVDGMVFLQTLVAEKKHLIHVAPVIFLSTEAKESVVAQARQFGAAGYLRKPISMRSLQRQIDSALNQHGDIYGQMLPAAELARPSLPSHAAGA